MSWWIPLAMGGAGLAKSFLVDKPAAERQAKIRAAQMRYSPWTGMKPEAQTAKFDPLGSMLGGALTGASMAGQQAAAQSAKEYRDKMLDIIGNQGVNQQIQQAGKALTSNFNPWGSMGSMGVV